MIISCVKDDTLGRAVRIVASPDEDIFQIDAGNAGVGRRGFPRLLIRETGQPTFETPKLAWSHDAEIPTVTITAGTLARWRFERRLEDPDAVLESEFAFRIQSAVSAAPRVPWVERLFRGIERAAGCTAPAGFRGFARRILEHPGHYSSLAVVADRVGLTAGALQGRFLRRGLRSPSEHLRWLRVLAVAEGLGDGNLALTSAAEQFGYTSAGNLCRTVQNTAGKPPSALRDSIARIELQTVFARTYLGEEESQGWAGLEDLFWNVPPVCGLSEGLTA